MKLSLGFLPNTTNSFYKIEHIESHLPALGGYFFPSTSTLGSQVHSWSAGIESRTPGMWLPQPNHEVLAHWLQVAFIHILAVCGRASFLWCL
ncbi:hypothetical protein HD806DRAFT_478774 [Xylariaceae sp. AK1471]|nr:hypothetical protein HD806DRAFT_478774 [Xylariaceae sp. AK1471]